MKCPVCSHKLKKDRDSGVKCPNCGHWIPEVTNKITSDRLELGYSTKNDQKNKENKPENIDWIRNNPTGDIPPEWDNINPLPTEPNWNLDKPDSKDILKKIKELNISGREMQDLSEIIIGCSKFSYVQRSFLHYCLALKILLDTEKHPQKTDDSFKWSNSVKIKIKGDE